MSTIKSSSEHLTVTSDGTNKHTYIQDNGVTKVATTATGIDVTGSVSAVGGISFNGDTAAANALDDYEEGTWTPTFGGSTADGTQTYDFQFGYYTKIGNVVYLTCDINASSISGQAGAPFIRGLPFTSGGGQRYPVPTFRDCTAMTTSSGYIISGFVNSNSNYIYMQTTNLTSNGTHSSNTWDSSGRMNFSLTYTVS